jgi:nitrate reductase molybdenum cofactor assembly chaperone NarJ/NarW
MNLTQSYRALAQLLDYPEDRDALLASCGDLAGHLQQHGLPYPAASFEAFLKGATLAELQEDYVANFDFNPAAAPYLGHHLYGDNQKKGAYLIRVKQAFGLYDFTPEGCELPDHLAVLLSFVAHLTECGEAPFRREFIAELVLPGLNKLVQEYARHSASPWLSLVEAAELLCSTDCKEVSTC